MKFKKISIILFLSIYSFNIFAQKDASYFPELCGLWLSENKKQKVRVAYDTKSKSYTGKLEWMYEDDQTQGRKLFDVNNPNVKLRTRRVTGINFLHSFKSEGGSKFRGYIYDPISGKEYRCLMTLRPDHKTAEIRGYILIPWIGRTEIATKIGN
jgi:uncharacterized protein (DUF2147 family)